MTRRLTRIEPVARAPSAPRGIAVFFMLVCIVGALPGLGLLLISVPLALSGTVCNPGALVGLPLLIYTLAGFGQMIFYVRRATGKNVMESARFWWASTFVHNIISGGVCAVLFSMDAHPGPFGGVVWFAFLAALALVAYSAEPPKESFV